MNIPYSPTTHLALPAYSKIQGKSELESLQQVNPNLIVLFDSYPDGANSLAVSDAPASVIFEVQPFVYDPIAGKRTPSVPVYVDDLNLTPQVFDTIIQYLSGKVGQILKNGWGGRIRQKQVLPVPTIPTTP